MSIQRTVVVFAAQSNRLTGPQLSPITGLTCVRYTDVVDRYTGDPFPFSGTGIPERLQSRRAGTQVH